MKVGILTQPLLSNYGGILQCYALQRTLQNLGHDAVRLDYYDFSLRYRLLYLAKSCVLRYLLRNKAVSLSHPFASSYARYNFELMKFIKEKIPSSPLLGSTRALKRYVVGKEFEGIVVGSDQIWNASYNPCVENYFLAFLPSKFDIKRVAYAASIGNDALDFNDRQKEICGQSLRLFDAVSVREESARTLLSTEFGMSSTVLLDPTMLLSQEEWKEIIDGDSVMRQDLLTSYVLDRSSYKKSVITNTAEYLHLQTKELTMTPKTENGWLRRQDSISTWLSNLAGAQFVITDSFHGCVFSIIFNKPFIAIANKERGLSRFTTLLSHFGLQHRLVESLEDFEQRKRVLLKPIDYEPINRRLEELKGQSLRFLADALS